MLNVLFFFSSWMEGMEGWDWVITNYNPFFQNPFRTRAGAGQKPQVPYVTNKRKLCCNGRKVERSTTNVDGHEP